MKHLKLFILTLLATNLTTALYSDCPFGQCRLRVPKTIVANRLINDRIITGYRVTPTTISLHIHLPPRDPALFFSKSYVGPIRYNKVYVPTGFSTNIVYGTDHLNIRLMNNQHFRIECLDYKGRKHTINSTMPHSATNFVGRIQISFEGNIIKICMPRF